MSFVPPPAAVDTSVDAEHCAAMPLYTPLGGSWLNKAESIQRILVRRALDGQLPQTARQIIDALEATARGWNQQPAYLLGVASTPLVVNALINVNSHFTVKAPVIPDCPAAACLCLTCAKPPANRPTNCHLLSGNNVDFFKTPH